MKYMGSKRTMLRNGLGEILTKESRSASRIVDLFCGAASVSWFVATQLGKPVVASDLQEYAAVLAGAVIKRTEPIDAREAEALWLSRAVRSRSRMRGWNEAVEVDSTGSPTGKWQRLARELCSSDALASSSVICRSYGGYYFCPTQALSFDAMLHTLPEDSGIRETCLAAVIMAASRCASSPGHTAQPFRATRTAGRYIREAWLRDPVFYARKALGEICPLHARNVGETIVDDANVVAGKLGPGDLVFVDPPYSAVQYSRFYHVLETIARGRCGEVEGAGRYPPFCERPNSNYSRRGGSAAAMEELLRVLSENGCSVVLTFPRTECSNGLSGEGLEKTARRFFQVWKKSVKSRFSTLGGNTTNRDARKVLDELMLVLRRKRSLRSSVGTLVT